MLARRMSTYVFDQGWQEERQRHEGMALLWDVGTFNLLHRLGVEPGWRCAEIGAGAGSVSRWLAARVGPEGHVLATDVDPRLLEDIDAPNVEVRALDVLADELPAASFDLVYARLVVEHIGVGALRGMLPALRPGGLLVIEDYDFGLFAPHPANDVAARVTGAILDLMSSAGMDPFFGRKAAPELIAAGLLDVEAEGRARVIRGGTPETRFFLLTFLTLRAALLDAGAISEADCAAMLASLDDPEAFSAGPLMVAAWGRTPTQS
jgi:SAM-dependent methyltransferase